MVQFGEFWKPKACGQTELPDRSVLIGQKLVGNAKIEKLKCDIFDDFQTLWMSLFGFGTMKFLELRSMIWFLYGLNEVYVKRSFLIVDKGLNGPHKSYGVVISGAWI